MVSKHYETQRNEREKFIEENLGGDGRVIDGFVVDKGHPNGAEFHFITDNGLIIVHNLLTGKLVTKKIARPAQIKKLYMTENKIPPKWLLDLAEWHASMHMNYI